VAKADIRCKQKKKDALRSVCRELPRVRGCMRGARVIVCVCNRGVQAVPSLEIWSTLLEMRFKTDQAGAFAPAVMDPPELFMLEQFSPKGCDDA